MTEKSITPPRDGRKTFRERVEEGIAWGKKKREEGWEETPDGLLPITEIKKAGYHMSANGEWVIPCEEYIADGNTDLKAGTKYYGPGRQYLDWRKARREKRDEVLAEPAKLPFMKIDVSEKKFVENDEIKIETIPF